ncbi:MAG: long-chain-acyl-CoA synthetase [Rhizomicrobium sp.]
MSVASAVSRESTYVASLARTFWRLRGLGPQSRTTIVDIVEGWARRTPESPAIVCGEETLSYAALDAAANRFAQWAHAQGVGKGDCVGILLGNRPDYVACWLGLFKLGAIAALINANLRGAALAHSIADCHARHLVTELALANEYLDVRANLSIPPRAWVFGGSHTGCENLDSALAAAPDEPVDPAWRAGLTGADKAFYVFTSGTTGPPKAANISHFRTLFMMQGFSGAAGTRASDRIYNVLPLYHSAGGICAPGMALTTGGCLILRRKFSVHEFWDDCARYKPTVFQYIGELCRYLVNAPPSAHERDHRLRLAIGNGLGPDIWQKFQARFAIPHIIEFYGATEGNVVLMNYDGRVGAVGRIPGYARAFLPTRLVRFDIEREFPVRDGKGFCVECVDGEAGEAIGKIAHAPQTRFEGYTRESDTEKKILRHVFRPGDAWFRTGDLMKRDDLGYFYFVDRIGDTFRWKGENVSTGEVAEALHGIAGIAEANVYGVRVPGHEGRAGMAALVTGPGFDPSRVAAELAPKLPDYARPLFLRILPQMTITGTFKLRKVELAAEGFDPGRIADPLYVLDPATSLYMPLDGATYDAIVSGRVRF